VEKLPSPTPQPPKGEVFFSYPRFHLGLFTFNPFGVGELCYCFVLHSIGKRYSSIPNTDFFEKFLTTYSNQSINGMTKIICPNCSGSGGAGGRCYKCEGSGWIDENQPIPQSTSVSPKITIEQYLHLITDPDSVIPDKSPKPEKHFKYCLICDSYVREDRWNKHQRKVHFYVETEPLFDNQPLALETIEPPLPPQRLCKKPLIECPICGSPVREDRLQKHKQKQHPNYQLSEK